MDAPGQKRWLRAVILLGALYLIIGVTFAALAGLAATTQMRIACRLGAWLISAAAFVTHVWHEQFRRGNLPVTTALHASWAAALGAFGLAVAANLHAHWTGSGNQHLLALALVTFPAITAVPAFVVAVAIATVLARTRRRNLKSAERRI